MENQAAAFNAWTMGVESRLMGKTNTGWKNQFLEDRPSLPAWWLLGFYATEATRDAFQFLFDMNRLNEELVTRIVNANKRRINVTTRTAEELAKLRSDFTETYGDAPVEGFEAAFAAHLAELDAASPPAEAAAPAPKKGKGGGTANKGTGSKGKGKGAEKGKGASKPKAPAAPKAKAFRATSADRQTFNAAAAKVAGKDVKTPRLLPKDGKSTYTDFLQGKVLKLDASGNGSTVLNVVSAKDTKTVLGTVTVEVKGGKVKATGAKA